MLPVACRLISAQPCSCSWGQQLVSICNFESNLGRRLEVIHAPCQTHPHPDMPEYLCSLKLLGVLCDRAKRNGEIAGCAGTLVRPRLVVTAGELSCSW